MNKNIHDKFNSHEKVNKMSASLTLQRTTSLENHKSGQIEATNVKLKSYFKICI